MTKIALLDFDSVLFDTDSFSKEIKKTFVSYGISESDYDSTRSLFRKHLDNLGLAYHQERHLDFFEKNLVGFNRPLVTGGLNNLKKEMPRFVYADAVPFLKTISEKGWKSMILTLGDSDWQKEKVSASGVGALVDDVVVTDDETKVRAAGEILEKLKNIESIIFVDDNPYRALNSVKEYFPIVRTFQLIRPELESSRVRHEGCDHDCRGLDEIKKLL
ncbi:MAG: HAD family hydrolase [Patescibacteria group bacterium]